MDIGIPELQEERLRERAFAEGRFSGLLFYYAAKRDHWKIAALESHLDRDCAEDRLVFDLFSLEEGAELPASWAGRVDGHTEPWLLYALAKGYLWQGRIDEVVALANHGLSGGGKDVSLLNLIAKYLSNRGARDQAIGVMGASLTVNPHQPDIEALRDALQAGARREFSLYLDVLPKVEPITFYLPVYNVERYIEETIEAILEQDYPIAELIVVDDDSQDRSIELAKRFPVNVLRHESNQGLAAARNTALRHAKTPYLASMDTDASPSQDYTKYVMMEFENSGPGVAGVGGRLIELNAMSVPDKWRALHLDQNWGDLRIANVSFLYGSNNLFRRDALLGVGGYDERHRTNGEDGDICKRLQEAGRSMTYTPLAIAYHQRTDTMPSILRTKWGWAFWARTELGHYENLETLVNGWTTIANTSAALLNQHIGMRLFDLLYVDYLMFYTDFCLDVDWGMEQGLLTESEARYLQDAMLSMAGYLDGRFGGALEARTRTDLAPFRLAPGPVTPCLEETAQRVREEIRRLYDTMNETVYRLICQGP